MLVSSRLRARTWSLPCTSIGRFKVIHDELFLGLVNTSRTPNKGTRKTSCGRVSFCYRRNKCFNAPRRATCIFIRKTYHISVLHVDSGLLGSLVAMAANHIIGALLLFRRQYVHVLNRTRVVIFSARTEYYADVQDSSLFYLYP